MMEQLRRTKVHFVHCFLPQHNSGLCEVKNITAENSRNLSSPSGGQKSEDDVLMNVPLVRSQVFFVRKIIQKWKTVTRANFS